MRPNTLNGVALTTMFVVTLVASGCNSKSSKATGGTAKAFLDQKKEVPPRKEWTREVTSRSGGPFTFRVSSQGAFAVTVVSDKAFKAMQSKQKINKEDILLTIDSKGPPVEKTLTAAAGSTWFIIENQTDKSAEIRLECFAP